MHLSGSNLHSIIDILPYQYHRIQDLYFAEELFDLRRSMVVFRIS